MDLKHDMRKPCHECPYIGKVPGWMGDHEHPQEFVDLAKADVAFPCHETVVWEACDYGENYSNGLPCEKLGCDGAQHIEGTPQQCVGQLLFMIRDCKMPRDPARKAHRQLLKENPPKEQAVWPGEELVKLHLRGTE